MFVLTGGEVTKDVVGKKCRIEGEQGKSREGRDLIKIKKFEELKKKPVSRHKKTRKDSEKTPAPPERHDSFGAPLPDGTKQPPAR